MREALKKLDQSINHVIEAEEEAQRASEELVKSAQDKRDEALGSIDKGLVTKKKWLDDNVYKDGKLK